MLPLPPNQVNQHTLAACTCGFTATSIQGLAFHHYLMFYHPVYNIFSTYHHATQLNQPTNSQPNPQFSWWTTNTQKIKHTPQSHHNKPDVRPTQSILIPFTCTCAYTAGTQTAFQRHLHNNPTHLQTFQHSLHKINNNTHHPSSSLITHSTTQHNITQLQQAQHTSTPHQQQKQSNPFERKPNNWLSQWKPTPPTITHYTQPQLTDNSLTQLTQQLQQTWTQIPTNTAARSLSTLHETTAAALLITPDTNSNTNISAWHIYIDGSYQQATPQQTTPINAASWSIVVICEHQTVDDTTFSLYQAYAGTMLPEHVPPTSITA